MKNIILLIIILFAFNNCTIENDNISVIDCACINPKLNFDTIKICNQVWMVKNLDVDHYQNCDSIPEITDPTQWAALTTGAWCYYNNDPAMGAIYGKLYNWYAINDPRGLAPEGWHIPTQVEWSELINCLGGEDIAGGKLKEAGSTHWTSPNVGATNSSGFTALGCGYRVEDGVFYRLGIAADWWTSTERDTDSTQAWINYVMNSHAKASQYNSFANKRTGLSVRCVKD